MLTQIYRRRLPWRRKRSQADRDYIAALTKRYDKDPKADQKMLGANYKAAMADLAKVSRRPGCRDAVCREHDESSAMAVLVTEGKAG
jgi:hypothetical protein